MADTKMSALPPAAALAGADIFAVAQGGVSKQASATQIATFVGGAAVPPFVDTQTIIKGSADATKLLRFEVDGFTAGVTNVLTPPNQNATIAGINVAQTFSAVQTFTPGSNVVPVTIVGNVTDPNSADFLDITGTWNTTAVQTAIKLDVTNTASGAGSLLLDLKTGTTKFNVGVTGATTITPSINALGLTFANQTYTADSPSVNINQTWNNAGVTFMAIKAMITDTASAAASSFIDLQLPSGTSKFVVRKDGRATLAGDILVAGALSPAITAVKVNVGIAAAQNVIRINGNSTADNAPVLDFLRSGNREWTMAPISNSFFISNSGGVANFNDATLNATPNWEFTSTGALKLNLGTSGTGLLHVNTDTTGAGLTIFEQASADTDDYDLSFRKARGTVAVPTVITSGDGLGNIMFRGYSGAAGYVTSAVIKAVSSGTIASTRVPSSLVFQTSTNATPSVLTTRLTIDNTGVATFTAPMLIETASGGAPGVFVDIVADANARIFFGLDSSNNPLLGFGAGATARDLFLRRDAAAVAAFSNTTVAAQTVRITETTDAGLTNYSRLSLQTQAGNHLIRTEAAGTGTLRILQVGTGPSTGTDIAGISVILHGGQSTGTGLPGAILFQQSTPAGGTGSGVNALATRWSIATDGTFTAADTFNMAFGTGTGTKIGTATTQKIAFWNKAPIIQPTNAIAAAAFVANTSGILNDSATFGGYTIGQIAAALIATGILT